VRRLTIAFLLATLSLSCDDSAVGPSGPPVLDAIRPDKGPTGTPVTLEGSALTCSSAAVKFGPGYVPRIQAESNSTVRFVVPDAVDFCAPGATGPCPAAFAQVLPGEYQVSVACGQDFSNALRFTVTAGS
jgi:hypothetical protein